MQVLKQQEFTARSKPGKVVVDQKHEVVLQQEE
jgi:hypothetical protein